MGTRLKPSTWLKSGELLYPVITSICCILVLRPLRTAYPVTALGYYTKPDFTCQAIWPLYLRQFRCCSCASCRPLLQTRFSWALCNYTEFVSTCQTIWPAFQGQFRRSCGPYRDSVKAPFGGRSDSIWIRRGNVKGEHRPGFTCALGVAPAWFPHRSATRSKGASRSRRTPPQAGRSA